MSTVVFPDPARVSLRRIALPVEQGGWSLAGEPVVLGMLAVPSIGGFLVGIAAIAAFLARQPVKIVVADVYWGRLVQRSSVAAVVAIVYLTTAAAALIVAVRMSGTDLLLPLLFAFPFAAVQVAYDGANESRQALPEVCGSIGIAGSVAMIATAGGAGDLGVVLWLLASFRNVGAVTYVRARLRLEKKRRTPEITANVTVPIALHLLGLAAAAGLALIGMAAWAAAVAMALLLFRTWVGLSSRRRCATPRQLGVAEIIYGGTFVVLTAVSFGAASR